MYVDVVGTTTCCFRSSFGVYTNLNMEDRNLISELLLVEVVHSYIILTCLCNFVLIALTLQRELLKPDDSLVVVRYVQSDRAPYIVGIKVWRPWREQGSLHCACYVRSNLLFPRGTDASARRF